MTNSKFTFTDPTNHQYTDGSLEEAPFLIPEEISNEERWITFRLVERENGKCDKVPHATEITDGDYGPFIKKAGVRSTEQFTDFMSAYKLVKESNKRDDLKGLDGVGFVLGDGYVGVDMDDCVNEDNQIKNFANEVLGSLNSFAEFSPSHTGLHVLCKGSLDSDYQNKNDDLGLEMYDDDGRFFTVTGNRVRGSSDSIENCTTNLRTLQRKYMKESTNEIEFADFDVDEGESGGVEDSAVVEKARGCSPKFDNLYNGGGNSDTSRGDLAFCRQLAFWTKENPRQIERIWKNSGRARQKLERDDYVSSTIKTAIESNDETYSGNY